MAEKLGDAILELATDDRRYTAGVARARRGAEELDRGLRRTGTASTALGGQLSALGSRAGDAGRRLGALNLGTLAAAAGLAVGIGTVRRLVADAVAAASAAEEIGSKFRVVFGGLAADTERWVATTARAIGRSQTDLKNYLATLQDTFVPLGFARERAAQMSQTLTQLAIDVASFNNAADAEVLRNFTSAIVGNHEAVRSYGIVITQARLDAELLAMGIRGGAQAASEAEKAQARLNLIVKSTADAQGDAMRTADSYANAVKALDGSWRDFLATLGRFITDSPSVGRLLKSLRGGIDALNHALARFQDVRSLSAGQRDFEMARLGQRRLEIEAELLALEGQRESRSARANAQRQRRLANLRAELEAILAREHEILAIETEKPTEPETPPPPPPPPPPPAERRDALARETEMIRERTAALEAETAALSRIDPMIDDHGYTLEQAAVRQQLLNAAARDGIALTPEVAAGIDRLAAAYAGAAAEARRLAAEQALARRRAEEFRDLARDTAMSFVSGMRQGKSAAEALTDALGRLADRLLDMAITNLFAGLFGGGAPVSPLPRFADGGAFTVGGAPGIDRNLVAFRASRGERVEVTPAGRAATATSFAPVINVDARGAAPGVEQMVRREISAALDHYSRHRLVDRVRQIRDDPLARG